MIFKTNMIFGTRKIRGFKPYKIYRVWRTFSGDLTGDGGGGRWRYGGVGVGKLYGSLLLNSRNSVVVVGT